MRRLLVIAAVVAVVLWPVAPAAQSAPSVYWTHDGESVSYFEIVVDGVTPGSNVGLPTPSGTSYSAALPTLTTGVHTIAVRACNAAAQCAISTAMVVVKL